MRFSLLKSVDGNRTRDAERLPISFSGVACPGCGDPLLILSLQESVSSMMRYRALTASRPALSLGGAGRFALHWIPVRFGIAFVTPAVRLTTPIRFRVQI